MKDFQKRMLTGVKLIKKPVYLGLIFTIALALSSIILSLFFFDNPRLSAASLYNAGVDVLGAFVCVVLFYGSMSQMEHATRSFRVLIVMACASFALNEWMWFTAGTPDYRTLYFWFCVLSKWFNLAMIYFFYRYVSRTLDFAGKLAKWADRAFPILLIVSILIVLSNALWPVSFRVEADGVYGKGILPWLEDLYLIIASLITTVLIIRCTSPRRQKWAAMSFILIPIVEFAASGGAFAYATQYGAVLLSLILMYCILFQDRSKKLAATQTELTMATRIQTSMLPSIFPAFPDRPEFDIYASMDPAKEVGGDFYDFFLVDDDHLCMVIADVSGKGVPAALFMMASKIILQSCAILGSNPGEILTKTNEAICSNNPESMFVTVWVGILELSSGKLTAANAGHEYPILKQPDGSFALYKDKHGLVIGGMDGVKYKQYEIQLEPGSKLFLYTDGVPEATRADKELFGVERTVAALNEQPDAAPQQLLKNVHRAVDRFVQGAEQFDDLTMLCVEYRGKKQATES